ncbi:MAG: hypothetical protein PHS31_10795 [Victivallaceae bacterium]|nr:hypothetical protein [Victivallaceae bacterium]
MNENSDQIKIIFNKIKEQNPNVDIMYDGILDDQKYKNTKTKILWILKQDYYDSGAFEYPYADRIKKCISDEKVSSSSTWRRMAYVSYGLLSGDREFNRFPTANICAEYLLETSVIEINKELGDSKSSNQVISEGFERYKDLITLQLKEYTPNIVIICLPNELKSIVDYLYNTCHGSEFKHGPNNVIIEGADVGIGKDCNPLFLWAYHPQATKGAYGKGVGDESYTMSLLNGYDNACQY